MKKGTIYIYIVFICSALQAFQFEPIIMDLHPQGAHSSKSFICINDSHEIIAVEFSLYRREIDILGHERLLPAPGDFNIYPASTVLEPGERQTIRLQYSGSPLVDYEKAYRIVAEQQPLDFQGDELNNQIRILYRYIGSIYVVPPIAQHRVELTQVEYTEDAELRIRLYNRGSGHVVVKDFVLHLQGPEGEISLGAHEIPEIVGTNILAGGSREFTFALDQWRGTAPLEGIFHYEGIR